MLAPCPSFQVPIGIPIFGVAFTKDNQLLLCGGGGAGRSGVKNKLCSYKVDIRRKDLEEEAIYELPSDQDAPMCLTIHPTENVAVAGINTSPDSMKQGNNDNCRCYDIGETEITFKNAVKSMESKQEEDYQKTVRFNKDGTLLATGTTEGVVTTFKYPSLEQVSRIQVVENNDVLDVDMNDEGAKLTAVIPDGLKLISLRGRTAGTVIQTVSASTVHKKHTLQFRSFRYGSGFSENLAFAVANGIGKSKGGFLVVLDAHTLEIKKVYQASKTPITAFCLSPDGSLIGYGAADFSISILEASTLRVLTRVKDAHGFSITSIAISPNRRILASGSADNTCRVVDLPLQFAPATLNPVHTMILAITVAVVLLILTTYFNMNHLRPTPSDIGPATSNIDQFKPSTTQKDDFYATTPSIDHITATVATITKEQGTQATSTPVMTVKEEL